jgi:hypothetical protein
MLWLILTGWNDSGYIFDGSSMMFKGVQSLVAGRAMSGKIETECGPPKRDDIPVSDIVLVHKLDALVN